MQFWKRERENEKNVHPNRENDSKLLFLVTRLVLQTCGIYQKGFDQNDELCQQWKILNIYDSSRFHRWLQTANTKKLFNLINKILSYKCASLELHRISLLTFKTSVFLSGKSSRATVSWPLRLTSKVFCLDADCNNTHAQSS